MPTCTRCWETGCRWDPVAGIIIHIDIASRPMTSVPSVCLGRSNLKCSFDSFRPRRAFRLVWLGIPCFAYGFIILSMQPHVCLFAVPFLFSIVSATCFVPVPVTERLQASSFEIMYKWINLTSSAASYSSLHLARLASVRKCTPSRATSVIYSSRSTSITHPVYKCTTPNSTACGTFGHEPNV